MTIDADIIYVGYLTGTANCVSKSVKEMQFRVILCVMSLLYFHEGGRN